MSTLSRAKKNIYESRKPWLIIITGVPATGKSTLAIQLAARLDWRIVVGLDEIKAVMKKYDKNKFLAKSSHDAWQLLGQRSKKNILAGFRQYCLALKPGVDLLLKKSEKTGENLIIEGVHLVPSLYRKIRGFNKLFIVVGSNFEKKHFQRIQSKVAERHQICPDVWSDRTEIFTMIQNNFFRKISSKDIKVIPGRKGWKLRQIIKNIANYEAL